MKEMNLSQLLDISHPGTLFELLGHYRVVVPAIQRHYVQGASTPKAKEVRERFLNDLFTHFRDNPNNPFKLDYVFGPIRTDGDDSFVPVDGQQRLTTLWLLARYAAEKLSADDQRLGILRLLERFSYEGRIYARRFCDALTRNDSSRWWKDAKRSVEKPSLALRRKGLLNPGWMADATVAAMSRMLDAIHGFWNDDIDAEQFLVFLWNQVRFELCHDQFADDIYMKMNARGLELTQWENFKGVFASNINDDSRKQFNEEIEKLSNLFYDKFERESDEWKKLPDQAFFALIARLADYVLRTLPDQSFNEDLHKNLSALANSKVDSNQPYVPIDEFCLGDIAKQLVQPFLHMVQWALDNSATPFKYWDAAKGIAKVLFYPENDDERDFSRFLLEYFSKHDTGNGLKANEYRALRLVANILENVTRQSKDNSSSKQFNRIEILKRFINLCDDLYGSTVELGSNPPMQCVEEKVKAALYETQDMPDIVNLIPILQVCEKALHGRVRIAILNLSNNNSEECILTIKNNLECLRQRLPKLQMLCDEWITGNEDKRAELFFDKFVPAFDWDIPNDVRLGFKDDRKEVGHGLRGVICTENDACLQRTLIDGGDSKGVAGTDYDIEGGRDWRLILCDKNLRQIFRGDGIKVKWHYASGRYYLYTGEHQVRWAYPISDYRIDVLFDDEFEKVLRQINPNSAEEKRKDLMRINDGSKVSFRMKNGLTCYFGRNDIVVKAYGEEGRLLQSKSWSYREFKDNIPLFLLGINQMTFDGFVKDGEEALPVP